MATPVYGMSEWQENQDQPHVTVNTELRILEQMSARIFKSMVDDAPPTDAEDGDTYYLDGPGTGEWAGHSDTLCLNIAGAWHFIAPRIGFTFYDQDTAQQYVYDEVTGNGWSPV